MDIGVIGRRIEEACLPVAKVRRIEEIPGGDGLAAASTSVFSLASKARLQALAEKRRGKALVCRSPRGGSGAEPPLAFPVAAPLLPAPGFEFFFLNDVKASADGDLKQLFAGDDSQTKDAFQDVLKEVIKVEFFLGPAKNEGWRFKVFPNATDGVAKFEAQLQECFEYRKVDVSEKIQLQERGRELKRALPESNRVFDSLERYGVQAGTRAAKRGVGYALRAAERKEQYAGLVTKDELQEEVDD